jgi:pimeloyl-ACP methyl ester carboxylesterase
MNMRILISCVCVIALLTVLPSNAKKSDSTNSPALMIEKEGSFFIGGTTRHTDALNGEGGRGTERDGSITTGQMYVQYQIPVGTNHLPVVMIHGSALSGQSFETTPDGRMGWSEYFARAGRPVYVVDQAGRARSGFDLSGYNAVRLGALSPRKQAPISMYSHEQAWTEFRIGPREGVPFADTQFPVEAIDAFYKMWIPDLNGTLAPDNPSYADLAELSQKVGGAILMGHSQAFMFPERAALINPNAVKGIISLESGYACAARFKPAELAALARIPILIVFADHLTDAAEPTRSVMTTSIAKCREIAAAIQKEGGDVTFLSLPEAGIHGNTHMFMLDKNNLQIADVLLTWIDSHVEHRPNETTN